MTLLRELPGIDVEKLDMDGQVTFGEPGPNPATIVNREDGGSPRRKLTDCYRRLELSTFVASSIGKSEGRGYKRQVSGGPNGLINETRSIELAFRV